METEIKLRVPHIDAVRRTIEEQGFTILHPRIFERNVIFDTPERTLRSSSRLLRLRQAGDRTTLTFKGPGPAGKHKSREERETTVTSCEEMEAILHHLGYAPSFVYEKFRTEFHLPNQDGVITLDETPIGHFVEIEGEGDWIDHTARILGFHESDYITSSYGALYQQYCRDRNISPGNMTFADAGSN